MNASQIKYERDDISAIIFLSFAVTLWYCTPDCVTGSQQNIHLKCINIISVTSICGKLT